MELDMGEHRDYPLLFYFCIVVELSGIRREVDIFVKYLFVIQALLKKILMEKIKRVVPIKLDFEYMENSTLLALLVVLALSKFRCKAKNGCNSFGTSSNGRYFLMRSLMQVMQPVVLTKF